VTVALAIENAATFWQAEERAVKLKEGLIFTGTLMVVSFIQPC
jgi:hypothetical protein